MRRYVMGGLSIGPFPSVRALLRCLRLPFPPPSCHSRSIKRESILSVSRPPVRCRSLILIPRRIRCAATFFSLILSLS